MNFRTNQLLKKIHNKKVGLFIENANWFYPQRELGWKISFNKLNHFLKEHCQLVALKLYAGTPLDKDELKKFYKFCKIVKKAGFTIETKPLKKIITDRKTKRYEYKCNFDVEIAFDIARHINKIDTVIIGSGDSDFVEARNYVLENKKGFIILCFEKGVAWEMRKGHHIFLENIKKEVCY